MIKYAVGLPDETIPDTAEIQRLRDHVLSLMLDTKAGNDVLGKVVRDAWVEWASRQPDPKPSWLVSYTELSEEDKDADRVIGRRVAEFLIGLLVRASYPAPNVDHARKLRERRKRTAPHVARRNQGRQKG